MRFRINDGDRIGIFWYAGADVQYSAVPVCQRTGAAQRGTGNILLSRVLDKTGVQQSAVQCFFCNLLACLYFLGDYAEQDFSASMAGE